MSGTVAGPGAAYSTVPFTDDELAGIRRMCGYPSRGDGNVVFPFPWIMRQFLALEYRLLHLAGVEMQTVRYLLAECYGAEAAIFASRNNLATDQAAVWKHNRDEVQHRMAHWRLTRIALCAQLDIPPYRIGGNGGSIEVVV